MYPFRMIRGLSYSVNRLLRLSSTQAKIGLNIDDDIPKPDASNENDETVSENLFYLDTSPSALPAVSPDIGDADKGTIFNATRFVPQDWDSRPRMKHLMSSQQPERPKQMVAALLGAPNSGKSTLANALVGRKVCSVSKRVDTTLRKTLAVATEGDTQIIFFDTPGIVDPFRKRNYADSLLRDPHIVLSKADVIIVVVDLSNKVSRIALHPEIVKVLHMRQDTPTILVLNKVDLIPKKHKLFDIVRQLTGSVVGGGPKNYTTTFEKQARKQEEYEMRRKKIDPKQTLEQLLNEQGTREPTPVQERESLVDIVRGMTIPSPESQWDDYKKLLKWLHPRTAGTRQWNKFSEVFLISALEEDGTEDINKYLMEHAKPGPWVFDERVLTDQNPKEIVLMTVREKLLDNVAEDVPYNLKLSIIEWKVHEAHVEIHVGIGLRQQSKAKMRRDAALLLGRKGDAIKKVGDQARKALMDSFLCDISLKIHVLIPKRIQQTETKPKSEGQDKSDKLTM